MQKRGAQSQDQRKKRSKNFHPSSDRGVNKSTFGILPNMAGVLVTCTRGKEGKAVREILSIFNEYADKLYTRTAEPDDSAEEETSDVEASIAKEVASLKGDKKGKRFYNINTNTGCMLFIATSSPVEPVPFVHHILTDLETLKVKKTRFVSRVLPIQKTCQANIADISGAAKHVLGPVFHTPGPDGEIKPLTFAVAARIRNCSKMERTEVINTLASVVGPQHKVDLTHPDYTIIAEICQNVCMMSCVRDFDRFKKYNIESIVTLGPEEKAVDAKVTSESDDKQTEEG